MTVHLEQRFSGCRWKALQIPLQINNGFSCIWVEGSYNSVEPKGAHGVPQFAISIDVDDGLVHFRRKYRDYSYDPFGLIPFFVAVINPDSGWLDRILISFRSVLRIFSVFCGRILTPLSWQECRKKQRHNINNNKADKYYTEPFGRNKEIYAKKVGRKPAQRDKTNDKLHHVSLKVFLKTAQHLGHDWKTVHNWTRPGRRIPASVWPEFIKTSAAKQAGITLDLLSSHIAPCREEAQP